MECGEWQGPITSDPGRTFGGIMRLIMDVPALMVLAFDQRTFGMGNGDDKFRKYSPSGRIKALD